MVGAAAPTATPAGHQLGAEPSGAFLNPDDLTEPETPQSNDAHVYGNVIAIDGISLDKGWFHPTNRWSGMTAPPSTVPTGQAKRAEVAGYRPGMVMTYRIVDKAGKPTDFWVGAEFYEPVARAAEWECKIYEGGDPRTDGRPTILAPYTCQWGNPHGYNPHPGLTVSGATVVTNKAQAKQLMTKYCNSAAAVKDCAFVNFGYGTALGPFELASDYVHNTKEDEDEFKVTWETETSEENSVGVELANEVELFHIWKVSLTLKYDYKWETRQKFGKELQTKVPAESVVWYAYATKMQTTLGTWVVNADGQRYSIPDVSLSTPLATGGVLESYGCKWTKFHDGACYAGLTTKIVPLH
ncbi:MAG: hypothetical protein ACR2P2_04940 [Nakamurella sp.]